MQHFYGFLIFLVVVTITYFLVITLIPMWRFLERKVEITSLYKILKTRILGKNVLYSEHGYEISTKKYTLIFHNEEEALEELQKAIEDALEYHDKLGWLLQESPNLFIGEKNDLIEMLSEVRTMKWIVNTKS